MTETALPLGQYLFTIFLLTFMLGVSHLTLRMYLVCWYVLPPCWYNRKAFLKPLLLVTQGIGAASWHPLISLLTGSQPNLAPFYGMAIALASLVLHARVFIRTTF